jgi:hypothetical protein
MLFITSVFAYIMALYPPQYKTLKMQFKPVFGTENLILEEKTYVTTQFDTVSIATFKVYISNLQYIFEDNSVFSEPNSYHLLDSEKEESLSFEVKNVPDKKLKFLSFNIGVDSLANVSGALTGDLDPILGMYWAWNTGYVHAKIEGMSSACKTPKNVFEFHIGGYLPPFNALKTVKLPCSLTAKNGITLTVDASKWFSNIKLGETNSVLMPNKMALSIANNYADMFKIIETDGK